jgi:hypothetical protein
VLTHGFSVALAVRLRGAGEAGSPWYVAVGAGDPAWDRVPAVLDPGATKLWNELARKAVPSDGVVYLDAAGNPSSTPTPWLRFGASFGLDDANGELREVGLFAEGAPERDAGRLVSYFTHAPIGKTPGTILERTLRLDLTRQSVGGAQPTRFLGNSHSRELHDLERRRTACRLEQLAFDHRLYFASTEQAIQLGYDYCAACFGRELSQR